MSFCGSWAYTLGADGRISLPAELDERLTAEVLLVIVRAKRGPKLLLWSATQWERERVLQGHRLAWWETEAGSAVRRCVTPGRRVQIPAHFRQLFGWRRGEELVLCVVADAVEIMALRTWQERFQGEP